TIDCRCVNGDKVDHRCICKSDFTGQFCEKKKHCQCLNCEKGWRGNECEIIKCVQGQADETQQKCNCNEPYSGDWCDELKTDDVYLYYNRRASSYGPIGILVVIPLLLIYYGCDRKARARTVQRARENLTAQNIMADKKKVSDMLQLFHLSILFLEKFIAKKFLIGSHINKIKINNSSHMMSDQLPVIILCAIGAEYFEVIFTYSHVNNIKRKKLKLI
ncbi:unnamed protein product, partial [Dracunculus medinensis]|uniref:EGF-like domain-containing protein n=1 Tax=Dracunculus medinensis TaxID=318479 RepID=A0A158Q622_DRAME